MPVDAGSDINVDTLVLVVVGAHPRAEMLDRAAAYRLRQKMAEWVADRFPGDERGLVPLVCTDVWYLNDRSLQKRPAVSIGGPGVNAYSAFLADKLPSAFVIDNVYTVQMDMEGGESAACCWGVGHEETSAAVDAFIERYLDGFMRSACAEQE